MLRRIGTSIAGLVLLGATMAVAADAPAAAKPADEKAPATAAKPADAKPAKKEYMSKTPDGKSISDSPYASGPPAITGGFTDTTQGGTHTSGDYPVAPQRDSGPK